VHVETIYSCKIWRVFIATQCIVDNLQLFWKHYSFTRSEWNTACIFGYYCIPA